MHFKKTFFYGFRNIAPEPVSWSNGLNLLVGSNGSGKSNVIEGLHLISGWGPLEKGTRISSLVQWEGAGSQKTHLTALVSGENDGKLHALLATRCVLRWDDKAIGATQMRSQLPVLTFLPGHLSIVTGSASHRRALLDILGALIYPHYARQLNDYRKILRHRVALLRQGASSSPTDVPYIQIGSWIWKARARIVDGLSVELQHFKELLPQKVTLNFIRGGAIGEEDLCVALQRQKSKEVYCKIPPAGAHKDDLEMKCLGKPAKEVLSRGHGRRVAIALMLASALLVEKVLKKKPILLLDEVTAELDKFGKELLLSVLSERGNQVFAATAEIEGRSPYPTYGVIAGSVTQFQ